MLKDKYPYMGRYYKPVPQLKKNSCKGCVFLPEEPLDTCFVHIWEKGGPQVVCGVHPVIFKQI